MLLGIGDLINTMLTASVAVLLIHWIGNCLGALNILALPVIAGAGAALIGLITSSIGHLILTFTTLQPLTMSMLVAALFAMLVVSPVSTVGLASAIGLTGLASGRRIWAFRPRLPC